MPRQKKRFSESEVVSFFERLPSTRLGPGYSEIDRAADFVQVFTTDQGQRVLAQIADMCNPHPTPADADKPGRLAFKEGQRFVLGGLMMCFNTHRRVPEIKDKPDGS